MNAIQRKIAAPTVAFQPVWQVFIEHANEHLRQDMRYWK